MDTEKSIGKRLCLLFSKTSCIQKKPVLNVLKYLLFFLLAISLYYKSILAFQHMHFLEASLVTLWVSFTVMVLCLYLVFSFFQYYVSGREARRVCHFQMENFEKHLTPAQKILLARITPGEKALGEAESRIEEELTTLYEEAKAFSGIDVQAQLKDFSKDAESLANHRRMCHQAVEKISQLLESQDDMKDKDRFASLTLLSKHLHIKKNKLEGIDGEMLEHTEISLKDKLKLIDVSKDQLVEDLLAACTEVVEMPLEMLQKKTKKTAPKYYLILIKMAINQLQICSAIEQGLIGKVVSVKKLSVAKQINQALLLKRVMSSRYEAQSTASRSQVLREIFFGNTDDPKTGGDLPTLFLLLNRVYGGALEYTLQSLDSFSSDQLPGVLNTFSDANNDGSIGQLPTYMNIIKCISALLTEDWEEENPIEAQKLLPKSEPGVKPEKEPLFSRFFGDFDDE